jgi:hypothetical protein
MQIGLTTIDVDQGQGIQHGRNVEDMALGARDGAACFARLATLAIVARLQPVALWFAFCLNHQMRRPAASTMSLRTVCAGQTSM